MSKENSGQQPIVLLPSDDFRANQQNFAAAKNYEAPMKVKYSGRNHSAGLAPMRGVSTAFLKMIRTYNRCYMR